MSWTMPAAWSRAVGAHALSVTLAGHNLATSTSYTGLDPEGTSTGQTRIQQEDLFCGHFPGPYRCDSTCAGSSRASLFRTNYRIMAAAITARTGVNSAYRGVAGNLAFDHHAGRRRVGQDRARPSRE